MAIVTPLTSRLRISLFFCVDDWLFNLVSMNHGWVKSWSHKRGAAIATKSRIWRRKEWVQKGPVKVDEKLVERNDA